MRPRDHSQVPVEQLASLLLERARADLGLPRRSPANSNEPPAGWTPPAQAAPCRAWLPQRLDPQPPLPGQERIADLVSQALAAAQEAEEIARAAQAASRRASRGVAVAIALGLLGIVAGASAGLNSLYGAGSAAQVQAAADPVVSPPAAIAPARPATDQTTPAGRDPAGHPALAVPALAPATYVRVLPAAAAQSPPDHTSSTDRTRRGTLASGRPQPASQTRSS